MSSLRCQRKSVGFYVPIFMLKKRPKRQRSQLSFIEKVVTQYGRSLENHPKP